MKINTPYDKNRIRSKPEKAGTETLVETRGYRSTKQQVAEYMAAGQQLQDYRNQMYDFPDANKIDEDYYDPTRDPGYDPADATTNLRAVEKRLRDQAKSKKREPLPDDKPETKPDTDTPKEEE